MTDKLPPLKIWRVEYRYAYGDILSQPRCEETFQQEFLSREGACANFKAICSNRTTLWARLVFLPPEQELEAYVRDDIADRNAGTK